MQESIFQQYLNTNLNSLDSWRSQWETVPTDETLQLSDEQINHVLAELTERLQDNYPHHHPRYAGQMLKPPHEIAMLAYMITMQINPNNHAIDSSAATSQMEREVIDQLARMVGFTPPYLGHLTASGTIANLEALWIARELHPEKAIVFSDQAHYTHERACQILRASYRSVSTDSAGRIDLDELRLMIESGEVGTVVATTGTTGMGAIDHVQDILDITQPAGVRLHIDAAYGGFYKLLADRLNPLVDASAFRAISQADSIVIDPHKHGLQPYGCGAVIFSDPDIGRIYQHDSPYTYFTSDELHLGEISLECSRSGAAAAAFWATLQCFPLEPEQGMGLVLERCRQAAQLWAEKINISDRLRLICEPDLDIICFYAVPDPAQQPKASEITALTDYLFEAAETDERPVYLAKFTVNNTQLKETHPDIIWDKPTIDVIRSVLMKPEHVDWIDEFHGSIERQLAKR